MRAANRQAGRRLFNWHYVTATGVSRTPDQRTQRRRRAVAQQGKLRPVAGTRRVSIWQYMTPNPCAPACAGSRSPGAQLLALTAGPGCWPPPVCWTASPPPPIGRIWTRCTAKFVPCQRAAQPISHRRPAPDQWRRRPNDRHDASPDRGPLWRSAGCQSSVVFHL